MTEKPHPPTLTEQLRAQTEDLSRRVGRALYRAGVQPDWVSVVGFVIVCGGAVLLAQGQLVLAGWVIAFGALLDALDGAVARARGHGTAFGAVLDSTLDRYADGFIFASFGYYFASLNRFDLAAAALLALVGAFNVSYLRARAANPDVNLTVKVGWLSRLERLVIVVWALWLHGWLLAPALWLLAAGTNMTALQRLWFIKRHVED